MQELLLEADVSPAETLVNPRSAQLFPRDNHCCPERGTERRRQIKIMSV